MHLKNKGGLSKYCDTHYYLLMPNLNKPLQRHDIIIPVPSNFEHDQQLFSLTKLDFAPSELQTFSVAACLLLVEEARCVCACVSFFLEIQSKGHELIAW